MHRPWKSATGSRAKRASAAFSLVEVTLALGVTVFCLLAVLGLLQIGVTSEKATVGQTVAADLISMVFSDLSSTSKTDVTTKAFALALNGQTFATPQTIYFSEGGKPTGATGSAPTVDSRYRVSVGIQSPAGPMKAPTMARILVTWPAASDPNPGAWPANQGGGFEVVTALDRN